MQNLNPPAPTPTPAAPASPFVWETPRLLRLNEGTRNVEGKTTNFPSEIHTTGSMNYGLS